jgi:hypothetical protein
MVLLNLIKSMFNTLFVPIYNLFEFFIISLTGSSYTLSMVLIFLFHVFKKLNKTANQT